MRGVTSGGRALLFIGLLALCAGLFSASTPPVEAQSPQDPSIVCPPPMPPFIQVPCFDLDDKDSTLPIDDDSRNKLDETNNGLRENRGGNWGQPSVPPADPGDPAAPAAPANLSVTPGEGYLDISWDAVDGATGYDVQAQTVGSSSWHDVASNVTGASHRYTTSATIDHVRVRASNNSGASGWTQTSRLPAADWLTTVQSAGGASASSGGSIAAQLAAPTGLTVTRENSARDEKLSVSWTAVTGATGYNLACADSPGGSVAFTAWKWWHCGSVTSGTTTAFTVDDDDRGGVTRDLIYARSYAVAVRAVTANSSDASPWTASDDAHPARMPAGNISVSRADGSLTLSWIQPPLSTGYEIHCATIENGVLGADQLCADVETATVGSDRRVTATITQWTVGGTTYTVDNSKTYSLVVSTTNAWGTSPGKVAPTIDPDPTLTASNVGDDSATLTIAHHTGAWYYKHTGAGATCDGPVSGTTKALTGLTGGTTYTYSAYSDSTCSTLLATAPAFTTLGHSVSNLSETATSTVCAAGTVASAIGCGAPFTTGTGVGGYTLNGVTLKFGANANSPSGFSLNLHEAASGGEPETSAVANVTFSGDAPSAAGDYTYSCSGTGCDLDPNETYYLVLTAPGSPTATVYRWITTASDNETATPSGSGWSIGNGYRTLTGSTWGAEQTNATMFKLYATENPGLTASSIAATTATLTISAHTDGWYYKATSGPHTTCQGPVAAGTSSASLTGLTAGTPYTYSAYSDSGCSTLLATAAAFTTPSLAASNVTGTGATLTITGHTVAWYYKHTNTGATCDGPVAAGTSTKALTGLTAGTSYTYSAYSDSSCATLLATAAQFTTLGVTVSNLSEAASNSCGFSTLANSMTCATAFTTGGESSGYSLESVTLSLGAATNGGSVGVAVHAVSSGNPSATSIITLSAPSDTTTAGNHTFTCSGNCGLVAGTTYFLVVSKTGASSSQSWNTTQSDTETTAPSSNGWTIANSMKSQSSGNWSDVAGSRTSQFRVYAFRNGGMSATAVDSGITTTATLTLSAPGHSGSWWYQGSQSGAVCTEVTSGTTATVTGLAHVTEYTYTAYNKSGCNSADEIAAVTFRTPPSEL